MNGFGNQNKSKEVVNKKINQSKDQIINQAFHFHSKGNITEAAKCYKYLVEKGLKDYRVFANYGIILNSIGQFKDAEILIRQAITLKPDLVEGHFNLGCILTHLGKLKEAESFTRKAIELKPNHFEAYSNLGSILSKQNELEKAELATRKAIELKPDYIHAHINLGEILIMQEKTKEGKLSLLKAIELNPEDGKAHFHISKLYCSEMEYREAFRSISSAYQYDPDNHVIQGEFTRLRHIVDQLDKGNKLADNLNSATEEMPESIMWDNEGDEVDAVIFDDQVSGVENFDL